jgi:hypothetical protein
MSAASAKRPASSPKAHAARASAKRQPGRPAKAATSRGTPKVAIPAKAEVLDGPGYPFAGFRMMCRHRHIRH